jgi:glycine dehydrogenase
MLRTLGVKSLQELVEKAITQKIRDPQPLPGSELHEDHIPEHEYIQGLAHSASKNKLLKSFIGCGFYDTLMPAVIQRNLL